MGLIGRQEYELSGGLVDATLSFLTHKSRMNSLNGSRTDASSWYDKLKNRIAEQVSLDKVDVGATHTVELSLRERLLAKRAIRFVEKNSALVTEHLAQSLGDNDDHLRLNGGLPVVMAAETAQARAEKSVGTLLLCADGLKVALGLSSNEPTESIVMEPSSADNAAAQHPVPVVEHG